VKIYRNRQPKKRKISLDSWKKKNSKISLLSLSSRIQTLYVFRNAMRCLVVTIDFFKINLSKALTVNHIITLLSTIKMINPNLNTETKEQSFYQSFLSSSQIFCLSIRIKKRLDFTMFKK
jgi:hypothetical protein